MPAAARRFSRCSHGGDCKTVKLCTGAAFGILPLLFPKERVPALPYSPTAGTTFAQDGACRDKSRAGI